MSQDHILRSEEQGVLSLTLNRADKLNAITPEMLDTIRNAASEFRLNPKLRVLLFKANGKFFSAGMDISGGMGDGGDSGVAFRDWYRNSLHTLFDELEAIEKPVVFAVQGPCLGGALEMALSADFRLCADTASFSLPEINLGLIPGSGGTSRLTRVVGTAWAKWLVMAGQKMPGTQAAQIGLVQQCVEADQFEQTVSDFVHHLAALPPEALGMAKLAVETVKDLDRASARNVERMANSWLCMSEEHKAQLAAFQQRKK